MSHLGGKGLFSSKSTFIKPSSFNKPSRLKVGKSVKVRLFAKIEHSDKVGGQAFANDRPSYRSWGFRTEIDLDL